MLLKKELARDSLLQISLSALAEVMTKLTGAKTYVMSDDRVKAAIEETNRQKGIEGKEFSTSYYPYASLNFTELAGRDDYVLNNTAMQRFGLHMPGLDEHKASTMKAHIFPVRVGVEYHYRTNDPYDALVTAEALVILRRMKGFCYRIKIGTLSFTSLAEVPESVSIPLAEVGGGPDPSGIDIALNFSITTYCGFFRHVAAVQSDRPNVSVELLLGESTTVAESFEYEHNASS